MTLRGTTAGIAATIGLAVAAAPAHATDLFATTDNTATTQNCLTEATACALGRAMNQVVNPPATASGTPNTLTLVSSSYDITDFDAGAGFSNFGSLLVKSGLLFQGKPGQPAPTIDLAGLNPFVGAGLEVRSGATLRHLNLVLNGPGAAVKLEGVPASGSNGDRPGLADRLTVSVNSANTAAFALGIGVGPHATVRNSVVSHTGGLAGQSSAISMSPFADAPRLFGVTALSATGAAIFVAGGSTVDGKALIFNSVARGAVDLDVRSQSGGTPEPITVELTNSAWRNAAPFTTTTGPATVVAKTPPVSADPKLDGGGKPLDGSPLIDAGGIFPELGPLDLDGNPRTVGGAPDIGAYEVGLVGVVCPAEGASGCGQIQPPPPPPVDGNTPSGPGTPPAAPKDTAGPVATFTTAKTLKRSKLTKRKGIPFVVKLNEPAPTAKLELLQITKAKGKKPAKEKLLATATRTGTGTTLTFTLKAKTSKVGKKGKRKLTLRFTFVDAAGNTTVQEKSVTVS